MIGLKLEVWAKFGKLWIINQVLDVLCQLLHMLLFDFLVWLPEIVIRLPGLVTVDTWLAIWMGWPGLWVRVLVNTWCGHCLCV